ncbi:hypothetical protein JOF41_004984 [Saccharothrix coeruleofusca]|uniref:hypothetical protein n=1 Tax=Saccharothrix coeruleofusca TaxID=33919 RepID=UPI001AE58316|nr:hypothetical protein [Saccharothrix coeruleofusca]MBP2338806.1 hypothetical protein [Saccharothrix coeruleofusca]
MIAVADVEHAGIPWPAAQDGDVHGSEPTRAMPPIRQAHGLAWYSGQLAAGYFRRVVHTFDGSSRAVSVPWGEAESVPSVSPVAVVFAACGAAATPLSGGVPPVRWRYCTSPQCRQRASVGGHGER